MRDLASILPLTAHALTFEVAGKALLDGVSFTLAKGGVTAIIGPNGAGKSLTLRHCHGLIAPTSGAITWNHAPAGRQPRRHAMVFQRPVMLRRSALANMIHALSASGIEKTEARAIEAMTRFGLSDLADRPARLLSGGEQQRLAIARAWALGPELMFLDEPTSQLDPGATRQIEQIIAVLATEGMTILMTTHDLGQARRLSQRILFMNKGRLVEDAPTDRFFNAPATAEARAFITGELLW
jgi:tungstate transport system ATP-binding protein